MGRNNHNSNRAINWDNKMVSPSPGHKKWANKSDTKYLESLNGCIGRAMDLFEPKKKKKIVDDKLKWEEGRHILVANPLQWRFRKKSTAKVICTPVEVWEMSSGRNEREKGREREGTLKCLEQLF